VRWLLLEPPLDVAERQVDEHRRLDAKGPAQRAEAIERGRRLATLPAADCVLADADQGTELAL
jgi:hypothetical protein